MKKTVQWLVALLVVMVVAGGCGGVVESHNTERRTPSPPPAARTLTEAQLGELSTLEQLSLANPPLRDLRSLALQLDEVRDDISQTIDGEAPLGALGDQQPFWVRNASTNRVAEITATLVYSTDVAYIWVESGQDYDLDGLQHSADRFSSLTYPRVVNTFGSEWRPGVDNDPRLHILYNTKMGDGVAGYFSGVDEYTRAVIPFSNQKEMFYINLATLNRLRNYASYDTTLAHELQHMIHWHMDRGEELWLNEGLSEYAQEVAGFSAGSAFAAAFAASPDLQLTTWGLAGSNRSHYGAAYLFMAYLAQRFGSEVITDLVAQPANGLNSVNAALDSVDAGIDAEELFADWLVANYANQPTALGEAGRYGYHTPALAPFAAAAQHTQYPVESQAASVANFAADYIELQGEGDVVFTFQGATETRLADTSLEGDGRAWWANRADDSDARLALRYDLSTIAPGTPLTLTASMWWDIEADYDFGYIMASADGEHWRILPGQHTAAANPSGNAFGPGYTGQSGDREAGASWVQETVDLTAFAGGPLLLQFRYITDDGVNSAGWFVDDVQLHAPAGPRTPAADGAAGEGGPWLSEGWLFTDNSLPQRWLVQVMEFEGETLAAVRRVAVDAEGRAAVEIAGLGNGRRAVISISGLSPVTTLPAQYQYAIAGA